MNIYENELYMEDVNYVSELDLPWDKLYDKRVLISGATGLIGSFLIDVLMAKNMKGLRCSIYGITRNENRAIERFSNWKSRDFLYLISHDINYSLKKHNTDSFDYVIHMASNTHPILYSSDPIGTITTNIIGLNNMLEVAEASKSTLFVFASSNEIYGENRGDVELFCEDYCGYIDCNTLRAGYPESKRCGEALCQAYHKQKGLNVVIPRFTRSYGPTMLMTDSKAISQFIRKGINGENIVLKSSGMQHYSYTYVSDAVSGLLYIMLKGKEGEAYNIADEGSDISLKKLAQLVADISGTKVVIESPSIAEIQGFSRATKARLDGSKTKTLGWKPRYNIEQGINRTISILRTD